MPVANTIGEIGRGFQQQMMQFQDERLVGVHQQHRGARGDSGRRRASGPSSASLFGKPLAKMQVTQFKFVEMLTQLTAARELTYACIRERNRGEDATQEITMAKIFCAPRRALRRRRVHPALGRLRLHEGERGGRARSSTAA